jgi:hypothetical protein
MNIIMTIKEFKPKGPGFGLPHWKGALHDAALLNILLECWSNGVLEKRKPNTDLL